jgi:predicted Zn finger-like uncharacterized protein
VFTRCTGCHTVHPVNAALLAQGGGQYRCGKCNKTNNALESLFDEWPAAGTRPPPAGQLPVLGLTIDLRAAARSGPEHDDEAEEEAGSAPAAGSSPVLRYSWMALAVAILVAAMLLSVNYFGQPPALRSALVRMGLQEAPPTKVFRDLSYIQMVSRELRSHPTRPGALQLSATIVNRAARTQPYPVLEVVLLDASGEALASHRFEPKDYLARGIPRNSGMTPQAYLPLVLELDDPGAQAVGFEINFR